MHTFEVGKPFPVPYPKEQGTRFSFDEAGPTLIISYLDPTPKEVMVARGGPLQFALVKLADIIYFCYKFTPGEWSECPFSACLYKNITYKWENINDGMGLALNMFMLNARNNEIAAIRAIGLSTRFSKVLREMVLEQLNHPITYERYVESIDETYLKYSSKELARLSVVQYKAGAPE